MKRLPAPGPMLIVVAAGALAATLDILYACVFWAVKSAVPPVRILQSVAAGLLGEASFAGGTATAMLGFVLHYAMMLAIALTYYALAHRSFLLRAHPLLGGAGYGLLVYAVMNYVVVPLSLAAPGPKDPLWIGLGVAVHVLLIGIPIALLVRVALDQWPRASR